VVGVHLRFKDNTNRTAPSVMNGHCVYITTSADHSRSHSHPLLAAANNI